MLSACCLCVCVASGRRCAGRADSCRMSLRGKERRRNAERTDALAQHCHMMCVCVCVCVCVCGQMSWELAGGFGWRGSGSFRAPAQSSRSYCYAKSARGARAGLITNACCGLGGSRVFTRTAVPHECVSYAHKYAKVQETFAFALGGSGSKASGWEAAIDFTLIFEGEV